MRWFRSLGNIVDLIAKWLGYSASVLVPLAAAIVLFEITMRYIFNAPTLWVHETSGFLFAALSLLAGAYCLREDGHVKMDFLYARWSPRVRAIVDILTTPLPAVFCAILLWKGGVHAWLSVKALETSSSAWEPPLWPFKLILPLAALMLSAEVMVKFFRNLAIAIRLGEDKRS